MHYIMSDFNTASLLKICIIKAEVQINTVSVFNILGGILELQLPSC